MPPHRGPFAALLMLALAALAVPGLALRLGASENMTPVLMAVHDAPVPFKGSDGRVHLVHELWMTNASSANVSIQKVEVIGDGRTLQTLDAAAVAARLQPVGQRESAASLAKSTQALLFVNVALAPDGAVPRELSHRAAISAEAAPPGHREFNETGGVVRVDMRPVVVIEPPLAGERYVSADSCCDATRHTRAALPVNGRINVAQRYAVDWEQLDVSGRIYTGPQEKLESYTIFGRPARAVADAPEQTPGKFPSNLPLAEADGNSVILDLGSQRYALYAHLQPGSIKVRVGDNVKPGQVIGLVGDSGNSIAPHLHFQVTAGPNSLSSNGLPYEIRSFQVIGKTPGTEAFDEAEAKGTALEVTPLSTPESVNDAMPLDQLITTFARH
jgi:Peptidase family M23